MTRTEWIEAFAKRFARLADVPIEGSLRLAERVLDGLGPLNGNENLRRDPFDLADEEAFQYGQGN